MKEPAKEAVKAPEVESSDLIPTLSGVEKAALLLLTLGQDVAAQILQHMSPKQVQVVGATMATMDDVTRPMVEVVINDFLDMLETQTSLGIGNDSYIRGMLEKALGEKAGNVIDRILMGSGSNGLEALKWMDPKSIAEIIRLEHPQIIAIVLSYLEADSAAAVLSNLPEDIRAGILMRIATLDGVQPAAIKELDTIMEKYFSENDNVKSSMVGGEKTAADILNFIDTAIESKMMDQVRGENEELANRIQDLMFVFDNLRDVDDRGIQTMLREISTDLLTLALKGVDEDFQKKFLKNMSSRAAEMLVEDMEAKGPVKLSEVEAAQKEILNVARSLEEAGEITLGGSGEAMV
ncbi:MAG: flagellar motor switch protein FliG [Gammaproteobacteria bacterium]|nr:flagellar motor switch protein FliG [Gammaproteobacteria bacterium]MBL6998265.1 flagellar motor switch protein FliG [Gammaproteobacteria bacterium]